MPALVHVRRMAMARMNERSGAFYLVPHSARMNLPLPARVLRYSEPAGT